MLYTVIPLIEVKKRTAFFVIQRLLPGQEEVDVETCVTYRIFPVTSALPFCSGTMAWVSRHRFKSSSPAVTDIILLLPACKLMNHYNLSTVFTRGEKNVQKIVQKVIARVSDSYPAFFLLIATTSNKNF